MTRYPRHLHVLCLSLMLPLWVRPCRAHGPAEDMAEAAGSFVAALTPAQERVSQWYWHISKWLLKAPGSGRATYRGERESEYANTID